MTKKELEKEAEEKADIYFNSLEVDNGNVSDTRFSDYDVFIAYEKGALDFAEPREKRITELEKENAELKEQNRKLLGSCEGATMMYEHLTKAIKIIKALLRLWNDVMTEKTVKALVVQAEQFLKEVDK